MEELAKRPTPDQEAASRRREARILRKIRSRAKRSARTVQGDERFPALVAIPAEHVAMAEAEMRMLDVGRCEYIRLIVNAWFRGRTRFYERGAKET